MCVRRDHTSSSCERARGRSEIDVPREEQPCDLHGSSQGGTIRLGRRAWPARRCPASRRLRRRCAGRARPPHLCDRLHRRGRERGRAREEPVLPPRHADDDQTRPLYDLVPTLLWPKLTDEAAMSINGRFPLLQLTLADIVDEVASWPFNRTAAANAATETVECVWAAVDGLGLERLATAVFARCDALLAGKPASG